MLSRCPENRPYPFGREPSAARTDGTAPETLSFDAHPRSSLIVALDFDSLSSALKFAKQVADLVGMFKIGSQLFTTAGPQAGRGVGALGPGGVLVLQFHGIPATVAGAILSCVAMPGVERLSMGEL